MQSSRISNFKWNIHIILFQLFLSVLFFALSLSARVIHAVSNCAFIILFHLRPGLCITSSRRRALLVFNQILKFPTGLDGITVARSTERSRASKQKVRTFSLGKKKRHKPPLHNLQITEPSFLLLKSYYYLLEFLSYMPDMRPRTPI